MKNQSNTPDPLAQLNFDDAFPPTPQCIGDAIQSAAQRIEQGRETQAQYRKLGLIAAAILLLVIGIGIAASHLSEQTQDSVIPLNTSLSNVDPQTYQVYASKDDPRFHAMMNCPRASKRSVALALITARAFGKTPCPECCFTNPESP